MKNVEKEIAEYRKLYGPGSIGYAEPGEALILMPEDEQETRVYFVPEWETAKGFRDKLVASREKGRKVFFDAYQDGFRAPYPEDALY